MRRTCRKCGKVKNRNSFYGLKQTCVECVNKESRARSEKAESIERSKYIQERQQEVITMKVEKPITLKQKIRNEIISEWEDRGENPNYFGNRQYFKDEIDERYAKALHEIRSEACKRGAKKAHRTIAKNNLKDKYVKGILFSRGYRASTINENPWLMEVTRMELKTKQALAYAEHLKDTYGYTDKQIREHLKRRY